MKQGIMGLAVVMACAVALAAELKSGLQVGDVVPSFDIKSVCGPDKGKVSSVR